MGKVKVTLTYSRVGIGCAGTFIADECEVELLRKNMDARIALIEKWKPELRGKIRDAYVSNVQKA